MSLELDLSFWESIGAIIFVLGVGFVSGRILGVRRGFFRAAAAGLLGSLTGLVVAAGILQRDDNATPDDVVLVAFGFALLATMVVSIVAGGGPPAAPDRQAHPAADPAPHLLHRRRSALRGLPDRPRHGLAGPRLASKAALSSPEGGLRIRGFLEDCGGMFIKFGQIASTRTDLLPAPLVAELADLQSNVKVVPVDQIRARIEDELEAPISEIFATFSDEPLAAASIGQTHVAVLHGGQRVVVKVRRPDVEVGVARDSAVLRWATRAAVRRSEAARSLGLVALADELIRSVEQELSYVHEAANARALGAVATRRGRRRCRRWSPRSAPRRCWCIDRVDGRPVSDAAAVDAMRRRRGRSSPTGCWPPS